MQKLLQHAATVNYKAEIDLKLDFLVDEVIRLEYMDHIKTVKEQLCITAEEQTSCQKVMDAFRELYSIGLLVLDAGEYGVV